MPLYNGLRDSYVVDSIGYSCVNGVLKRHLTLVGVTILTNGYSIIHIVYLSFEYPLSTHQKWLFSLCCFSHTPMM
jgi:hypothetical protein